MKVLNLYSGLGGNRKLWKNVNVTAVELNEHAASIYQKLYQEDKVIIEDAHKYLIENYHKYDFIWSSPPCQSHSKMMFTTNGRYGIRKYPDMDLYEEILWLRHFCKGKWVVENVQPYYTPLIPPDAILGRHCFWANFPITSYEPPELDNFIKAKTVDIQKWLGLGLDTPLKSGNNFRSDQAFRNCVHPKIGLHVFNEMPKNAVSDLSAAKIKSKAISIKQKQYEIRH